MTDSGIVTSEREKVLALLKACLSTDTTNNSVASSEALCTFTEYFSTTHPDFGTYFKSHVLKKIEHNLQVGNISKYSISLPKKIIFALFKIWFHSFVAYSSHISLLICLQLSSFYSSSR